MTANNSTKITLTEEDISGASLRGKIPSALTIPELKRWLSCRKGAKLSGTKRTLVKGKMCAKCEVRDLVLHDQCI